jgi:hypothetical protein
MEAIVWITGETVTLWVLIWYLIWIWFGITCLRKGHWIWFIIGIFLPFLWLIGAILPDRRRVVVVER